MIVFLNGQWLDEHEATIPIDDRGFLYADGVFETALLYRGRYFHLRAHIDRLAGSAAALGIPMPDLELLHHAARGIADRNALEEGSLRITIAAPRGSRPGTTLITIAPRAAEWVAKAAAGWHIVTASTTRPSITAVPAQLKALGRTYALLARQEALRASVDDVLLLTDDGMVCEGPTWNVFWRTGKILYTPALELGVLAGITRSVLVDTARAHDYDVREGAFPRAHLDAADEIFATMTSVGLARVRSIDGRQLDTATPAADLLFEKYWEYVTDVCDRGGE